MMSGMQKKCRPEFQFCAFCASVIQTEKKCATRVNWDGMKSKRCELRMLKRKELISFTFPYHLQLQDIRTLDNIADLLKLYRELKKYSTVIHGSVSLKWYDFIVEFLYCDLASMKSIRQFVQQFRAKNCPLHVLVNNAGVMMVPERKTEDGFEEHFGLNYLGHFLLTNLLLDTLKQSGTHSHNARIITVSSATHYVGKLHLNDLQSRLGGLVLLLWTESDGVGLSAQYYRHLGVKRILQSLCTFKPFLLHSCFSDIDIYAKYKAFEDLALVVHASLPQDVRIHPMEPMPKANLPLCYLPIDYSIF
ncbi:hypothetical protein Q9966_015982 [Columba livia]|nr:hypothetical protein Q9966_015982 [Columba livia]